MDALTIKHASAMPAPTWSWLRMNDTKLEIPCALERVRAVTVEADETLTETHASFEGAVAKLQERLDAERAGLEVLLRLRGQHVLKLLFKLVRVRVEIAEDVQHHLRREGVVVIILVCDVLRRAAYVLEDVALILRVAAEIVEHPLAYLVV